MANPWFRMYAEFATDPKVQMMSEADQRRFVMLLCLRCSNDDVTLHDDEVAFQLRISNDEWSRSKGLFLQKGLINEDNTPTSWDKRQFVSDSSATRVAKHREKRKQLGMTATDHIRKDVRARVMEKCGNACVYCGSTEDLTMDHIVPTRRGGLNEEENLQVACRVCNADKRHMTHEEYLNWNGRVTLLKRHQKTEADTEADTDTSLSPAPEPAGVAQQTTAQPEELAATRKGAICRRLRHEARVASASPHQLTDETWDLILSKRTDEEIIEFAKAKAAEKPGVGLRYLAPGLLEDPKPIATTANGGSNGSRRSTLNDQRAEVIAELTGSRRREH